MSIYDDMPWQLGRQAAKTPDKPALVMARSGEVVTYRELEERSSQFANLLLATGLKPGDHMAMMMENHVRFYEILWGTQRVGMYHTPVNWHLTAAEAAYIVNNCEAQVFVTSQRLAPVAGPIGAETAAVKLRLMVDGTIDGYDAYEAALAAQPTSYPPADTSLEGSAMFYSSGTTGRPKGILRPLTGLPYGSFNPSEVFSTSFEFDENTIYLNPAPLYHAAPNHWSAMTQRMGGTTIVMESFDPEEALALIEKHRITHAQFVPTMFVRMLKLPEEVRRRYDVSSLKFAIHAAAPCPVEVKRQMIEWWGPVIYEYFAASEGGWVTIAPEEWLAHPGSVGKPAGNIRILDDDLNEVPQGTAGVIYFEGAQFNYHNDPDKTTSAYAREGLATVGDIGYVDPDGYLFLTDRRDHMIISGGVNIYPQEAENVLIEHPKVMDAAVIGVPNEEMGEEVKAVVQLVDPSTASDELAAELITYCRQHLTHYKCPRTIDFRTELPRLPTGKLLKRVLRDEYRNAS
ncbi:MAG: acyl-CoA synthetase [Acidimicrobiia bacterium]